MAEEPDREREPEGDHAAERLEEFLRERFPAGLPPEESPREPEADPESGEAADSGEAGAAGEADMPDEESSD